MEQIRLTVKALMYLSAKAGAQRFYGIRDVFYGEDEAEVRRDIRTVQDELVRLNYADMDFDGKFSPDDTVMSLVRVCALCEKYIALDIKEKGKSNQKILYYLFGGDIVKVLDERGETAEVHRTDFKALQETLKEAIVCNMCESLTGAAMTLKRETLTGIKAGSGAFNGKFARDEFKRNGLDDNAAKALSDALSGNASVASVVLTDFKSEKEPLKSLMLLHTDKGTLRMTPVIELEDDAVEFMPVDKKRVLEELEKLLEGIGTKEAFE